MGIYDRKYYQEDQASGAHFFANSPVVKTLILINVALFLLQILTTSGPGGIRPVESRLISDSARIFDHFEIWRLLTGAFLHDVNNPLHILFNMLILYAFGRELEARWGGREFAVFYLIAAVFSMFVQVLVYRWVEDSRCLGASGAIAAVFAANILLSPMREILVMFVIPMQSWMVLVGFVALDTMIAIGYLVNPAGTDIAAFAHLGGFAFGFAYVRRGWRLTGRFTGFRPWKKRFQPRVRVIHPDPEDMPAGYPRRSRSDASASASAAPRPRPKVNVIRPDEDLDSQVDEILAKIARSGRETLTETELKILEEASRRARDRRNTRLR